MGGAHQLVVVAVGAVDDNAERHAAAVSQHGALDPALGSVCWIWPGFPPHRGAPCPLPHPAPAMSSRCRSCRRRPEVPCARTLRTPQPRLIPGSGDAPMRKSRFRSPAALSTGIRSAIRRRSRPSPPGPARAGYGSRAYAAVVAEEASPSSSTTRQEAASRHRGQAASWSSELLSSPSFRCR